MRGVAGSNSFTTTQHIQLSGGLPETMTSLEIAGVVKLRHDNVKRTIDTLIERGVIGLALN